MSLDLLESGTPGFFLPDSIVPISLPQLFQNVPESVKQYARALLKDGWRIYCVSQSRGRCYGRERVITIPLWATKRDRTFITWYISHELAHAYDRCLHNHGPQFMEWLKQICPADSIQHELGYKPRNARAAGIGFEL